MPMDNDDPSDIAHERASRYAPLPAYKPLNSGIVGAFITGFQISVFMGLARLNVDDFAGAVAVTSVVGFALPFAYFWNQERKYYAAWASEYKQLQNDRYAKRP